VVLDRIRGGAYVPVFLTGIAIFGRPGRRPGAADVHQRAGYGDGGEHQVDVQGVAPREVLGEGPAEDQAHRAPASGHRAENPEGPARSRGSWKLLTKVPWADGARSAPNAPCRARAATSIPNETAAPPSAEAIANPAR